jgi:hypothetical protein
MARTIKRDGEVEGHNEWQPHELNLTVRRVCRECNNEWMSVLEGKAGRILRPIISGHDARIGRDGQAVVARWSAKMALMLGYAHGIDVTPQEDRYHLRTNSWPSDKMSVAIAAYNCGGHFQGTSYCLQAELDADLPADEFEGFEGYAITFAIGYFAAQVIGHFGRQEFAAEYEGLDDAIIQVWPTATYLASWPPHYSLDGATLERFAHLGDD